MCFSTPKWFRPWVTVPGFTFFISIYGFFSGFFALYTVSQLTSIAKQFNMSSERSGFIVSCSEFGFIVAAVLTGHFFSRAHRPRILFFMGCINCTACCVAVIPYLLDLEWSPSVAFGNDNNTDLGYCDAGRVLSDTCDEYNADEERATFGDVVYGIFLCAATLVGLATSGVWTIGVTYIDDNCDAKKSAMYIGIVFFMRMLSPVGALFIGTGFAALPLHLQDEGLTPESFNWVGAWWLGYIFIGITNVIVGIPLLLFPKHIRNPKLIEIDNNAMDNGTNFSDVNETDANSGDVTAVASTDRLASSGGDVPSALELCKDFPRAIGRLACNPILMMISLAQAIEFAVAVAYPVFIPMYLEIYFRVTAWTANIITGVGAALAVALGSLIAGILTSIIPASLNKICIVATGIDFVATILGLAMLAIHCDSPLMAGVNTPGSNGVLTAPCNAACNCDDSLFNPICGNDGVTYTSPCHAGCSSMNTGMMYTNCTCIPGLNTATPGPCGETCSDSVVIYGAVLFVISFILAGAAMPLFMLVLRCTAVADKTLAVAFANVMASLGIIPTPVIFGLLIDTACLLFPTSCGGGGGYCLFYDNQQFRFVLHIITFCARLLPTFFYGMGCYAARNTVFAGDAQLAKKEQKTESFDNPAMESPT